MEPGLLLRKRCRLRNNMVMRFGNWDVRIPRQAGNMNVIAEEVERYKMDVAALQEVRWKAKGSIRKPKFTLHYSGNEDRQGNRGVGFIASKKASRSVLGFSPTCEGICTLRIKGKFHNITFVYVYSPTEDTEDGIGDEFYETPQFVCDVLPKHEAIITLGDFNAKLGKEQLYKDITGRYSLHEVTNNSGLRLVQYATIWAHGVQVKIYTKELGTIPDTIDTNQIDHIPVSERWATDIENVRTYRGANSDFDHFLVGARLKQRLALRARNRTKNRKRWNVDKFNERDVEHYYQQEVQRKLQEKPPSNETEEEWAYIKRTLTTSAQNIIGERQNEIKEEWYEQEGREMIEVKREARLKCIQRNT